MVVVVRPDSDAGRVVEDLVEVVAGRWSSTHSLSRRVSWREMSRGSFTDESFNDASRRTGSSTTLSYVHSARERSSGGSVIARILVT